MKAGVRSGGGPSAVRKTLPLPLRLPCSRGRTAMNPASGNGARTVSSGQRLVHRWDELGRRSPAETSGRCSRRSRTTVRAEPRRLTFALAFDRSDRVRPLHTPCLGAPCVPASAGRNAVTHASRRRRRGRTPFPFSGCRVRWALTPRQGAVRRTSGTSHGHPGRRRSVRQRRVGRDGCSMARPPV